MSPLVKALLATALTLPLVAFVAGVLASPDPVDPERSRPVIIGRVNDDQPVDKPSPSRSRKDEQPTKAPRNPGDSDGDDAGEGDDGGNDADEPAEEPGGDVTDDQPYTVVTPPPRDLDGDGDDGDDDGDDDDDDDSDDRGGSGDD